MGAENEKLRLALRRESEKVRALQDIGAALGSTLDLDELLAVVLRHVSSIMAADRSTLYLLDEATGQLWSKIAQGEETREIRLNVGDGIAGWVAKTMKPLRIDDVYQDLRFDSTWDQQTGYRTCSALCVPMKNQHGRLIGVIQVLNKLSAGGGPEGFDPEDEDLLTSLAAQAAVSVENSKLFLSVVGKNMELLEAKEALERKVRELDVLFEVAQVSASAVALDELLEGLLARTMRAIDVGGVAILLHRKGPERQGELRFRAAVHGEPGRLQQLTVTPGEGVCGWVAKNQKAQLVHDVSADDRHVEAWSRRLGFVPQTLLSVPLRWEGGCGALDLWNKGASSVAFGDADRKLATMIAGHISTAIGNAERRQRRHREERLSSIGQFLSSILHDLKTPMTVIQGYVKLLADEEEVDQRKEYAGLVTGQIQLVNAMTRETLAFARGDRKLLVRKVYLKEFFSEIHEQLDREFGERGMTIEVDLSDRGVAHFDPQKIQRAIHNLARNASEAASRQARTDSAAVGVFRIQVDRTEDGGLRMAFSDNGPGIPQELLPDLFDAFSTQGKPDGTGLGLAVVRQVVEDHQGKLEVRSAPGVTEFLVQLPAEVRPSVPPT